MNALVSGQLGIAFFLSGNEVRLVSVENTNQILPSSWAKVAWMLHAAPDFRRVDNVDEKAAVNSLLSDWQSDRCIQLILILLNSVDKGSIKRAAVGEAERLLESQSTVQKVASRFYSNPIENPETLVGAMLFASESPRLLEFLNDLESYQDQIRSLAEAWEALPLDYFDSLRDKSQVKEFLVQNAYFHKLAKSLNDKRTFDKELLSCMIALEARQNARMLFSAWLSDLTPKRQQETITLEPEEKIRGQRTKPPKVRTSGLKVFSNVQDQKIAIYDAIAKGDIANVWKYTRELIAFQLDKGAPQYAAMTLCDLAQRAKEDSRYNLQNELCMWAVEVHSDDGWSHGQLADSYFCLGRLDDARKEFEKCIDLDERAFGLTGIAKIYQKRGDLIEALDQFNRARDEFPEEPTAVFGVAEVLRDLRRWDEALDVYRKSTLDFPNNRVGFCGVAAVLNDIGSFEESRDTYQAVLDRFEDDPVALGGLANTFTQQGLYDQAIEVYGRAIEFFPNEAIPLAGRADTFRAMGAYDRAIADYEFGQTRFENNPTFWTGLAEVYRSSGDLKVADTIYREAVQRFEYDPWARAGMANILKLRRQYEDSLQSYDNTVSRFPYHAIAWSGRADLLRILGRFEDSLTSYKRLKQLVPHECYVDHAMAAILSAQGHLELALTTLGRLPAKCQTREEWIAYHVYGMILLRQGDTLGAGRVFRIGITYCSWVSERRYFYSGLALAKLQEGEFQAAVNLLQRPELPFEKILSMHAHGEAGQLDTAQKLYDEVRENCPPVFDDLLRNVHDLHFTGEGSVQIREAIQEQLLMGGCLLAA